MHTLSDIKLALIGLGYVGLPLAVEFPKQHEVLGFGINDARIDAPSARYDSTLEASDEEMREAQSLCYSADPRDPAACNVSLVTIPSTGTCVPTRDAAELLLEAIPRHYMLCVDPDHKWMPTHEC